MRGFKVMGMDLIYEDIRPYVLGCTSECLTVDTSTVYLQPQINEPALQTNQYTRQNNLLQYTLRFEYGLAI